MGLIKQKKITQKKQQLDNQSDNQSDKKLGDMPFLLTAWLDAIAALHQSDPKIFEEIEGYAHKQWASYIADELEVEDEPIAVITHYYDLLATKGIIERKDFTIQKKAESITITVGGNYHPLLKQGRFLSYLIKVVHGKIYDAQEKDAGKNYRIVLSPGAFTLKVGLSYKIGRGSINVSDKDLDYLGLDLIESVTLVPAGKDTGIGEMMFSGSKVTQGFVIMNIQDASLIGLKEGDRVELIKKEEETAEEQVGDKTEEPAEKSEEKSAEKNEEHEEEKNEEKTETPAEKDERDQVEDLDNEKEETTEETKQQGEEKEDTTQSIEPEIPKQKKEIASVKQKPPLPKGKQEQAEKKQKNRKPVSAEDKAKQMKDFEDKIDALRN